MVYLTHFVIIADSASPTNGSVSYDQLKELKFYPSHANVHHTTYEQPGLSEQSSDPSLHAEVKPEQPTDDEGQLIVMPPICVSRQQQKVMPFSLVAPVNIPVKLKDAMKFIVIGHYVDVFRSIYCYFENVVKGHSRKPFTGFSEKEGIILDFGLGTKQHLPVQALNHPAFAHSDEYESIVQLIMIAILIAPNPEKNLATFLKYHNVKVPESLELLYRARLPSVATNQKLQYELAQQGRYLANWLRTEAGFASNKHTLYLAHIYVVNAFITKQWKADFHAGAMEEQQKYKPRKDFEKVILRLESICSAQSQGYAYAEMVTNGTVVRRKQACGQSMVV